MLQNDLKAKMRELDAALCLVHSFGPGILGPGKARAPASAPAPTSLPEVANGTVERLAGIVPFAEIDGLTSGSPAALAGMQVGDRIVAFGPLVGSHSSGDASASAAAALPTGGTGHPRE